MPGKHAPESPTSFYLSVARAVGGALVVLGVVALIAIAAVGSNNKKTPKAGSTVTPKATATHSVRVSPTVSATASPSVHPNSKVTINVLNGTTTAGLARRAGETLSGDGYVVKKVDNCGCGTQSTTTIYYRPGEQADAQALLRKHPELGRIKPVSSSIPFTSSALLTVVLGTDYNSP